MEILIGVFAAAALIIGAWTCFALMEWLDLRIALFRAKRRRLP